MLCLRRRTVNEVEGDGDVAPLVKALYASRGASPAACGRLLELALTDKDREAVAARHFLKVTAPLNSGELANRDATSANAASGC
jgi:hypothetical protein